MKRAPKERPPLHLVYVFIYEMMGSIILHLGMGLSAPHKPELKYMHSLAIFVALALTDQICIAHFNIAITIPMLLYLKKFKKNLSVFFVLTLAEIFGGFIGMIIVHLLVEQVDINEVRPRVEMKPHQIMAVEATMTFILVAVALNLKFNKKGSSPSNILEAMVSMITVGSLSMLGGNYTGSFNNPNLALVIACSNALRARSFGLTKTANY